MARGSSPHLLAEEHLQELVGSVDVCVGDLGEAAQHTVNCRLDIGPIVGSLRKNIVA